MPLKRRSAIIAVCALLMMIVLIYGGGFRWHAALWSLTASFGFGLILPGVWVFRDAANRSGQQSSADLRRPLPAALLFMCVFVPFMAVTLSGAFFRSEMFATAAGQHGFAVCMGLALSQLAMVALGFYDGERRRKEGIPPSEPR